jgi:hypothetical protein
MNVNVKKRIVCVVGCRPAEWAREVLLGGAEGFLLRASLDVAVQVDAFEKANFETSFSLPRLKG